MPNRLGSRRTRTEANTLQGKIWQSMYALRHFDLPTLTAITDARYDSVARYVYRLRRAGYVRLTGQHVSGRAGSFKHFILTRYTGPKPPIIGSDGRAYDQNLEQLQEDSKETVND